MDKIGIPEIDEEILDAINSNSLIIFAGAGVSCLYGYPTWRNLGIKLINECVNKGLIKISEKEELLSGKFDNMQLISVAAKRYDKKFGKDSGLKFICESLSENTVALDKTSLQKRNDVAKYLSNYNSLIITTNADLSLDCTKFFSKSQILTNFYDWDKDFSGYSLIHLHGAISNLNSMVFTASQYAKAYMPKEAFGENLIQLLKQKDRTILFIGYSMSEFELLKYFLTDKNKGATKMYLLKPYLDKEQFLMELDKEYFMDLGIKVIPYSREKYDYQSLIKVLSKWNKAVTTRSLAHLNRIENVSNLLMKAPSPKSIEVIKDLLNDK